MKFISQKECVFAAVCAALALIGEQPRKGFIAKDHLSDEMRKTIIAQVTEDLREGNAPLKTQYTDEELEKYVPGMVSNHLRKDTRLNGGDKYEIQNPGVMTGNKDPQIKETRKLLKQLKDAKADAKIIAKVESVLEGLVNEWKAKNGKVVEIQAEHLPEELKKFYEDKINAA